MNGLRTRLRLDHSSQEVHNTISNAGDRIVGWFCAIGLIVFIIFEIIGRFA